MFHNHTENSPSTGEPPTPSTGENRLSPNNQNDFLSGYRQITNNSRLIFEHVESRRSNDSGYELSPTQASSSDEFFTELEVFEDTVDDSDTDDELCSTCGDDCCQCLRSKSSRATVRSPDTPSNLYCDIRESSFQPPSSLPIPVPHTRPTAMLPSMSFSVRHRQRQQPSSMPAALTNSQSLPVFQEFLCRSQPRMWPTTIPIPDTDEVLRIISPYHRLRRADDSTQSFESFFDLDPIDGVRDDEVFQEDMYEMVEEDVSFHPATDYRRRLNSEAAQPLPDLLLHASPRRGRSASVNLPPDHAVLRDIGRSLRRISDEWVSQQQSNERRVFHNHLLRFKFLRKSDHS